MKNKLTGIYPISPNYIDSDSEYLEKCFVVINSGISIFQFRAPNISSRKRRFLLNNIYKYCIDAEVQLIINNDYYLVKNYEGAGIHIGRDHWSGLAEMDWWILFFQCHTTQSRRDPFIVRDLNSKHLQPHHLENITHHIRTSFHCAY